MNYEDRLHQARRWQALAHGSALLGRIDLFLLLRGHSDAMQSAITCQKLSALQSHAAREIMGIE
jgi:hypothetical protein